MKTKTLTKIKLIHWHGFFDETIEVSNSILLTGENGSGKSTLVDALYFLLSGGETNRFNVAANDSTNRTIESYMRGKTGVEGKSYLRPETPLISHLALEFLDRATQEYFVLGVCLEIQEGREGKVLRSFYKIDGPLEEKYFSFEENGVKLYRNYRSMSKEFEEKIHDIEGARKDIRSRIYGALGIDDGNKYYEILAKALAFKPIPDVNDFVYQFLMPEADVNVENIRAIVSDYAEIQAAIRRDKAKKEILEKIIETGDKLHESVLKAKLLHAAEIEQQIQLYNKRKEDYEKRLAISENSVKEAISGQKRADDNLKEFQVRLFAMEHSDAYQQLADLEKELTYAEKELHKAEQAAEMMDVELGKEREIASLLGFKVDLGTPLAEHDQEKLLLAAREYRKLLSEEREKVSSKKYSVQNDVASLKEKKALFEEKMHSFKRGVPDYDPMVTSLMEAIEKGIYQEEGAEIHATPLCELIDIASGEEMWRDALEGYLNTRRFDLLVPEAYYDKAIAIYEREKNVRHIYGVGLVNTAAIRDSEVLPNSLAEKVVTKDDKARRYCDYLLGQLVCVENEQELKHHDAAITKTVMVYRNHAARQTRQSVYAVPYIGRSSIAVQTANIERSLKDIQGVLMEKETELRVHGDRLSIIDRSSLPLNLDSAGEIWRNLDSAESKFARLNKQKAALEKMDEEGGVAIASLKEEMKKLELERDAFIEKQRAISGEKSKFEAQVYNANAALESLIPERDQMLEDLEVAAHLPSFMANQIVELNKVKELLDEADREERDANRKLVRYMSDYINEFHFDCVPDIDSLDIFHSEYNLVVKRDLAQFEEKVVRIQSEAAETFKNEYIGKIRKLIIQEEKDIAKLNSILKERPFGADEEVYQFKISRSLDDSFGVYYDIFKSNKDYSDKDLFTNQLDDKDLILMRDLFNRLTAVDADEKSMKLAKEYTDYRKFMNYDIVITNKRGEVSYFSKINKEKSGGETQTPFYVIIAASFDQILTNSISRRSAGCLLMLDEAFNNMDGDHIDSMMDYFASLAIQPIIVVPSQRAKAIMPYVGTTIGLVKIDGVMNPIVQRKEVSESVFVD
ncbi:MAG: hypothetical protein J6328_05740 [Bacilli bacterium]|nr:hypothetical protein [Bacilli bacterium]